MPWVEPIARRAAWVTIAAAILTFLALARNFVIPLALAILFAFALSPVVRWLDHRLRTRLGAVVIASVVAFAVVGSIGAVAAYQMADFASRLSDYRHSIAQKVIAIRGTGEGLIGRTMGTMNAIQEEVDRAAPTTVPTSLAPGVKMPPIPVRVQEDESFISNMTLYIEPVIEPLVTAGVVVMLTFLLLLYSEDLRDRVVVLAGTQQLTVTSQALEEAAKRVGKYLLALSCVNGFFGVAIATGLYFIGLENALLLGLIAGVLRFVPLLGAWLGALLPIAVGMAVFDHWQSVLMIAGLFVVMESITNFAIEPFLYGHSTGVSGTAIVVAILFWTWIWGPLGLLVAVPITVCLVVFGKYVEPLRVFHILFSDEPMLAGERRLYHRLVTGDIEDAEEIIEKALQTQDSTTICDELLLPVLRAARSDNERGSLSDERLKVVVDTLADLVAQREPQAADEGPRKIACVAVESEDRGAAQLLASGAGSSLKQPIALFESALLTDLLHNVQERQTSTLILVSFSTESIGRARLLVKALQLRVKDLRILIADLGQSCGTTARETGTRVPILCTTREVADRLGQIALANVGLSEPTVPPPTVHTPIPAA